MPTLRTAPTTSPIQSQDLEHSPDARRADEAPTATDPTAAHAQTARRRYERIAKAAYRRAEQRGFAPGGEIDDWLAAERECDAADNLPRE